MNKYFRMGITVEICRRSISGLTVINYVLQLRYGNEPFCPQLD